MPRIAFEQRALSSTFLRIVAKLPKRPEPRGMWDCRFRDEGRSPHPAIDAVLMAQGAMRSAIETGDPAIVRETRLAIEQYFDDCAAASIAVGTPLLREVTATDVVTDQGQMITAVVAAKDNPSPGAWQSVREYTAKAADSAAGYLRTLSARQRSDAQWGSR